MLRVAQTRLNEMSASSSLLRSHAGASSSARPQVQCFCCKLPTPTSCLPNVDLLTCVNKTCTALLQPSARGQQHSSRRHGLCAAVSSRRLDELGFSSSDSTVVQWDLEEKEEIHRLVCVCVCVLSAFVCEMQCCSRGLSLCVPSFPAGSCAKTGSA